MELFVQALEAETHGEPDRDGPAARRTLENQDATVTFAAVRRYTVGCVTLPLPFRAVTRLAHTTVTVAELLISHRFAARHGLQKD